MSVRLTVTNYSRRSEIVQQSRMRFLAGSRVRHVHVVHENVGSGTHNRIPASRHFSGNGLERVLPQHQGNGSEITHYYCYCFISMAKTKFLYRTKISSVRSLNTPNGKLLLPLRNSKDFEDRKKNVVGKLFHMYRLKM